MKREASVLIDSFPMEPIFTRKPKVIVRRVSQHRYRKPKPKYRSHKNIRTPFTRKPTKKFYSSNKYGRTSSSKRAKSPKPKPSRYRGGKPSKYNPRFSLPKHNNQANSPNFHNYPEMSFAEPPTPYTLETIPQKPTYGEPPVDSYGAPLKPTDADNTQQFPSYATHFENEENDFGLEHHSWISNQYNPDNIFAYSKQQSSYIKPDLENLAPMAIDYEQDTNHGYPYVAQQNQYNEHKPFWIKNRKKKKVQNYDPSLRLLNEPWKSKKNIGDFGVDEILVGGRYAEPPARYVQKFQSNPMFSSDGELLPANGYVDSEVESATISPYVNYKNSNMAFSPQNLNDAFSIVDK